LDAVMTRDMQLLKPTPDVIELFTERFQDRFGRPENAIKLLLEKFPDNRTLESILLKSIVINVLYATQILAIIPVAEHILSLDIDDRLSGPSRSCRRNSHCEDQRES
jgi:hypothetical protein